MHYEWYGHKTNHRWEYTGIYRSMSGMVTRPTTGGNNNGVKGQGTSGEGGGNANAILVSEDQKRYRCVGTRTEARENCTCQIKLHLYIQSFIIFDGVFDSIAIGHYLMLYSKLMRLVVPPETDIVKPRPPVPCAQYTRARMASPAVAETV